MSTKKSNILTSEQKEQLQLVRYTFLLSQGDANFQRMILQSLGKKGVINSNTLLAIPHEDVIRYMSPPKNHKIISEKTVGSEKDEIWSSLGLELHPSELEEIDLSALDNSILAEMIDRDLYFQHVDTNRLGRREDTYKIDSDQDPHASQIRRYLIHDENIAPPALKQVNIIYAELFSRLRQQLFSLKNEQNISLAEDDQLTTVSTDTRSVMMRNLSSLEKSWENNHPGEIFFPLERPDGER